MFNIGFKDEALGIVMVLAFCGFSCIVIALISNLTERSLALTNGYNEIQMTGGCGKMWQKNKSYSAMNEFGELFKGGKD